MIRWCVLEKLKEVTKKDKHGKKKDKVDLELENIRKLEKNNKNPKTKLEKKLLETEKRVNILTGISITYKQAFFILLVRRKGFFLNYFLMEHLLMFQFFLFF